MIDGNDVAPPSNRIHDCAVRWVDGFMEVLQGADPSPVFKSERVARGFLVLAWFGVATAVFAIFELAVSFHGFRDGSFGVYFVDPFRRVIAVGGFIQRANQNSQAQSWPLALLAVAVAPIAVRFPLLGWRVAYVATLLIPLVLQFLPLDPLIVVVQLSLLLAFSVWAGLHHSRQALWWMAGALVVPIWLWLGLPISRQHTSEIAALVTVLVVTVIVDAVGAARRTRIDLLRQSDRANLEGARRVILQERARIARELHDVIAHHMSLIAVQAESAPYRHPGLRSEALEELASVGLQAREALSEMRRLLGVLRNGDPVERLPQPHVGDIPSLIESAMRSGVDVTLVDVSAIDDVPNDVGLCAYRIVQEALSNAARHSPGCPVAIRLEREDGNLVIYIRNEMSKQGRATTEEGLGLIGMGERVRILGGDVIAAPDGRGGFIVHAVLPVVPQWRRTIA